MRSYRKSSISGRSRWISITAAPRSSRLFPALDERRSFVAFFGELLEIKLRAKRLTVGGRGRAFVGPIGFERPGLDVVVKAGGEDHLTDEALQRRILDGKRHFVARVEIARHPVRAGKINFLRAARPEIIDAAVLQKPVDHTGDADVFA